MGKIKASVAVSERPRRVTKPVNYAFDKKLESDEKARERNELKEKKEKESTCFDCQKKGRLLKDIDGSLQECESCSRVGFCRKCVTFFTEKGRENEFVCYDCLDAIGWLEFYIDWNGEEQCECGNRKIKCPKKKCREG